MVCSYLTVWWDAASRGKPEGLRRAGGLLRTDHTASVALAANRRPPYDAPGTRQDSPGASSWEVCVNFAGCLSDRIITSRQTASTDSRFFWPVNTIIGWGISSRWSE